MDAAKKIVLFNPKTSEISRQKGILPLALLAISGKLADEGYNIMILDEMLDTITDEILDEAFVFGIGAMIGYQINSALKVAKRIKESNPEIPIIWGGWHPSIQPEQTIRNRYVDFVIRGQGEITFYKLVKCLETQEADLSHIKGLTYKVNGKVLSNPERPLVDPNTFPRLPYHLIDMEKYIHDSEFGKRTISYLSSVGCPHACGFCAEQLVHGRRWLPLTADRVVDDLEFLVEKYNLDSIAISDSDFFINEKRVADICSGVIYRGLNINWGNVNGRADELCRFSEATWELMRDSGLQCILTGAETSDETILELINKGATVQDTVKLSKLAKKYGIIIKFSFMVGLPIENRTLTFKEEFIETIDFINTLYAVNRDNIFLVFLYTPFPGTPLFEKSIKLGYKNPESLEEWADFQVGLHHASTPWTDEKIAKIVYQVNFFFPFVSNVVYKIISQYPLYKRMFLLPLERILFLSMNLRLKKKFFSFPVEYYIVKTFFLVKNRLGKNI